MVAFFYFRARRRDIAIARTLGVPSGVCMRQGALIGLVGTVDGTVSGWQYALNHGVDTLASLSVYGGDTAGISLPHCRLAAIFGGISLLVSLLALGRMRTCPTGRRWNCCKAVHRQNRKKKKRRHRLPLI